MFGKVETEGRWDVCVCRLWVEGWAHVDEADGLSLVVKVGRFLIPSNYAKGHDYLRIQERT